MPQFKAPRTAEAAPVSRNGFEYSFYAWQMSYLLFVAEKRKCQVDRTIPV